MKRSELEAAIRDEVEEWPGVTVEFVNATGGGHPKAKLTFGDLMLSRPYPSTPSDAYNGLHKCLGDMRRVMKQLGAERSKPEPSKEETEKRYAKPNPGRELRELPVGEKAPVKPDIADQLVEQGAATPEAAKAARASVVIYHPDKDETDAQAEVEAKRAAFQAHVDAIVDGIYFDLPEEIYHAVPRLGSGNLIDLAISPADFWAGSWLDPKKPEFDAEQTAAQLVGKAYHCARLEPSRFRQAFVRELDRADFPQKGFVANGTEIGEQLSALGETKKRAGESVADQAQRLEDAGYHGTIWPLEQARWRARIDAMRPVPTPLSAKIWDEITTDMERIHGSGEIAEKLSGGFAEVAVFWTDQHGLKCKAKFDYLRVDLWGDLKTFDNPQGKKLFNAIRDAFQYNYYFMQAVHYRDGAEAIRVGGLQIIGDATDEQRKMIAAIQIRPVELECWYIFQQKKGVPNLLAKQVPFFGVEAGREYEVRALVREGRQEEALAYLTRPTKLHNKGRRMIEAAKRDFDLYSQIYPEGAPWQPIDAIGSFDDLDFRDSWLESE